MELYPDDFMISRPEFLGNLWGNEKAAKMFSEHKTAEEIIASYKDELNDFVKLREKYLLY
jgi:uncharacterized protein YbbC (DUF1343 family)